MGRERTLGSVAPSASGRVCSAENCQAEPVRSGDRLSLVRWQFDMTWRLAAEFHLSHLDDDMCFWTPAPGAFTVRRDDAGSWRADWDDEDPPSPVTIGWLTWHVLWWWGELSLRARGEVPPRREHVLWPGTADAVRDRLTELRAQWTEHLGELSDTDLDRPFAFPWPEPRPFVYAAAWVNSELMKNVAEIGAVRHQYLAWKAHGSRLGL